MKRVISVCFFILFAASGCVAASPADVMKANFRLLADNIDALSSSSHPKLHYLGVGFYPEPWSENDVVRIGDRLSTIKGYAYAPIILSNRYSSIPEDHPAANRHVMEAAISHIAEDYQEGDLVVVAISTHGTKGAVVVREGENAKKTDNSPRSQVGVPFEQAGERPDDHYRFGMPFRLSDRFFAGTGAGRRYCGAGGSRVVRVFCRDGQFLFRAGVGKEHDPAACLVRRGIQGRVHRCSKRGGFLAVRAVLSASQYRHGDAGYLGKAHLLDLARRLRPFFMGLQPPKKNQGGHHAEARLDCRIRMQARPGRGFHRPYQGSRRFGSKPMNRAANCST